MAISSNVTFNYRFFRFRPSNVFGRQQSDEMRS